MLTSQHSRMPRRKLLLAVLDAIFTALAMLASVILRLGLVDGLNYFKTHWPAVTMAWLLFGVSYYVSGLYDTERLHRVGRTLTSTFIAVSIGMVMMMALFYAALSEQILGRMIFAGYALFVFASVLLTRLIYIAASYRGLMAQRCLIIGTDSEARKVVELVESRARADIRILGLISCGHDHEQIGKFISNYPVLGSLETVERFVQLYNVERLIIAASTDAEPGLLRRLRTFRYRGMALVDFVSLYEELAQEIPVDHINDEWLFHASMNNSRIHIRRLKRLLDILTAIIGLLLTSWLMLLTAVLVRITSKGEVLFRQERLGRDSRPFTLMKFRTMRENAESQTGPVWATDNDPRTTWLGKWLRKFRIDELPQLINVLRGNMSLVGPRPERAVFIQKLSEALPFYSERLLVPPGITGWAQVMAPYAASIDDSKRKLQYDLYYIKHMSFTLDILIFAKTIRTIIFGRERHRGTAPI
ncbi:MAG: sugar transferase [Verrucomicrobiota bacterium]